MNRAFSDLTIRSVDEEKRIIRGRATSPRIDRVQDIIEPLGCTFQNPCVLLLQHIHDKPCGTVVFSTPTKDGVDFEAHIPKIDEPGILQDRTNEAWQSVKSKIIRHVSIGFRPIGEGTVEVLPNGGLRYRAIEIFELSLVSVPAQPDAEIFEVRGKRDRTSVVRVDVKGRRHPPVVKLSGVVRAAWNGTLKINVAPRYKPGDPIRIVRTGPRVVKLSREDCVWLNEPPKPLPVVKLTQRDRDRAKHRVVKLGRR